MTSAELKTIREYLGLPVAWLAKRANVQERTVRYWESGRSNIPEDVITIISDLKIIAGSVTDKIYEYSMLEYRASNNDIVLYRYKNLKDFEPALSGLGLPPTFQTSIIMRVFERFNKDNIKCNILYAENE